MIDKTKELGLDYIAITDIGNLSSIVRAYTYGEKKGVKIIPGIEIVFKDSDCPIIEETESAQIKYFKFIVHAQDQEAFQQLVKMSSDRSRRIVEVGEHEYRTFNWKDLEELSKYNVTVTNSNVEDLITKHLLVDRMDISLKYYRKVKDIFGTKYYPSIIPYKYENYWQSMVEVTLGDNNHVVHIPANDRIETDHYKKAQAKELPRRGNRHKMLQNIYINKIKYPVKYHLQEIKKARLLNEFQPLPGGDIQTKANKFILAVAEREGDLDRLLINNYSYYADEGDQVVQSMKLGEEKRIEQKQHMRSLEESKEYLQTVLGLGEDKTFPIVGNSHKWAEKFSKFSLQYDYRLPKVDGDPKEKLLNIINEVGRMNWDDERYVKQFNEELALLTDNGVIDLVPYFLPIVDINKAYKDNGYLVGPGRGSAGGFLISYLTGITHINPIQHELSSSRFLTIDRVQQGNLPDIDVDYESRIFLVGKDGNGGYLFNRWGNRAAQISTRTLLRIKSAILDANRFVNKGKLEQEIQALSKSLPNTPQGVSDQDFVFGYENSDGSHEPGLLELNEDLQKYATERPQEWDIVKRALSLSRQKSRHACSFLISDRPIEEDIPIFEVGGVKRVTQYEHKHCEWAGMIKYDFLVVDAVKKARVCLDYINKKNGDTDMETGYFINHDGKKTFVWDLPNDIEVYRPMWEGKTETIFQFASATATPLVMDIKPQSIIDLATITSLGRPGPLDFKDEVTGRNMAEEYGYRKRGQSKSKLAIMDEMLPETHGVLCIAKGSRVKTEKRGLVKIEDVAIGERVQTETGEYKEVIDNIYKGKKKVINVRLDNSEEINLTGDHKVLTNRGWIEAKKLTKKDLVKHFWASDKTIEEGTDKDWVIGMLLADGQLDNSTYNIAAGSKEKAEKIKLIVDNAFNLDCYIYFHTRCWYVSTRNKNFNNKASNDLRKNPLRQYCKKIKIDGLNCYNKKFPEKITKRMIEGFIEGDGNIKNKRIRICNETMARQIFETFQAMRIKSNLFNDSGVWTVGFNQSSLSYKIKQNNIKREKSFYIPKPEWKLPRKDNRRQYFFKSRVDKTPFISYDVALDISKDYNLELSKQSWSKVLSISDRDVVDVYDLSIDEIHSFVVGGNVVHNCYQEQVTKLAKELAGMSVIDAENVRIAVGKKKKKLIDSLKPIFIEGASKKIPHNEAVQVWDMMETFARYGFNKSHAVAYSVISYACAYFKHHYPLEWWAAVISTSDTKKINEEYYQYIKDMVLPPDINISTEEIGIDYNEKKIRSKLSMISGLGKKVANKIMDGRPYKDLQDFITKKVCGPSLTRKLIHVGVLDSFFEDGADLMTKMQVYEDTAKKVEFLNKLDSYQEKIETAEDEKAKERTIKNMERYKAKGPKKGKIDPQYMMISPKKDYMMKKDIFPTMNLDLNKVLRKESNTKVLPGHPYDRVFDQWGHEVPLVSGEHLQRVDEMDLGYGQEVILACPAYVIEAEEFSFQNNTKKALSLTLDSSGYISEKVLWADYDTGKLEYPKSLKKGAIVYVFYKRKLSNSKNVCYTNITNIIVEQEPL